MIVNLEDGTVTFTFSETLTVDQIYALLDLLEVDDDEPCHLEICEDCREKDNWVYPKAIYQTRSDNDMRKYYAVVVFEDNTWACSCPDWIHRKSLDGGMCKHIRRRRIYWLT